MPRIVKDPKERKEELMKAALSLFETEGYNNTSVDSIVNAAGVAKGTFYYYFKSKESILEALFTAYLAQFKPFFSKIQKDKDLKVVTKIQRFFQFMLGESEDDDNEVTFLIPPVQIINFIRSDNSALVLNTFGAVGRRMYVPILTSIIKEGNRSGELDVEYPRETIELLLEIIRYIAQISYHVNPKEFHRKLMAVNNIFTRALGIKEGLFQLKLQGEFSEDL